MTLHPTGTPFDGEIVVNPGFWDDVAPESIIGQRVDYTFGAVLYSGTVTAAHRDSDGALHLELSGEIPPA